jgi:F420H(2)-dependent quinone reductase
MRPPRRHERVGVSSNRMNGGDAAAKGRTRMWRFRTIVKRYVNPFTRPVAKRLPSFAILTHRGRKSGRLYRTPMNVFRRGDEYFF